MDGYWGVGEPNGLEKGYNDRNQSQKVYQSDGELTESGPRLQGLHLLGPKRLSNGGLDHSGTKVGQG